MFQFLINCNQPLPSRYGSRGEQFALSASEDAFWVRHSLQNFKANARQFAVLFADMVPPLIGQPNRYAVSRSNSLRQGAPLSRHGNVVLASFPGGQPQATARLAGDLIADGGEQLGKLRTDRSRGSFIRRSLLHARSAAG